MHQIHKGHEKMHLEMFMVAMISLFGCQALLMTWKHYHFTSYQLVTLVAMWIIPFFYCLIAHFPRFVVIWFLYSLITGTTIYLASKQHIVTTTPRYRFRPHYPYRRVYRWFLLIHNISYTSGLIGYAIIMLTMFQLNLLFVSTQTAVNVGLLLLFYGLYFGVISRDFAEICTNRLAARIGFNSPKSIPVRRLDANTCSLCLHPLVSDSGGEKSQRLNCSHYFHDYCIRGWCMVGKKDTCPYCGEKVNLQKTFTGPWLRPQLTYGLLLDWVRYLVAWQPVIVLLIHAVNSVLGLE